MVMSGVYYSVQTLQRLVRLLLAYHVSHSRLKTCSRMCLGQTCQNSLSSSACSSRAEPRDKKGAKTTVQTECSSGVLSACSCGVCSTTVTQVSLMHV